MVGLLVSRRRARRRRLHRAAHLQRARREAGPAFRSVVQHRPLRHSPLAVDPHWRRRHRALSRPRASRDRIHDGTQQLSAAPVSRHRHRWIPRRLHVHDRNTVELGRVVPRVGLLPPLHPQDASEGHYVFVSRLATVLLVIVSAWISVQLGSIASGWEIVLQVGAGTGAVYILRWYWWRINAWSEISAMACSLAISILLSRWHPFNGNSSVVFAKGAIVTTIVTTLVWATVTLLTRPEPQEVLTRFYRNVRPDVRGWQRIADMVPEVPQNRDLGRNLWAWALGCAMVYLCLFGTGKMLLQQSGLGLVLLFFSAMCACMLCRGVVRNFAVEAEDAPGTVPDWVETPVTPGH